jgi:hypothetical protein
MTDTDKKGREALGRLVDVLVQDVLAASDDEILAEFAEAHGDPAKNSTEMRALFEKSVLSANKDRLRAAKAGLAASRASAPTPMWSVWQMPDCICDKCWHPALPK